MGKRLKSLGWMQRSGGIRELQEVACSLVSHVLCKAGELLMRSHWLPFCQGVTRYSFFSSAPDPNNHQISEKDHREASHGLCLSRLIDTRLQPQLARECSGRAASSSLWGLLLVPLRSLAGSESFTPAEHWLCAYMSFQRKSTPVNNYLASYELSGLARQPACS